MIKLTTAEKEIIHAYVEYLVIDHNLPYKIISATNSSGERATEVANLICGSRYIELIKEAIIEYCNKKIEAFKKVLEQLHIFKEKEFEGDKISSFLNTFEEFSKSEITMDEDYYNRLRKFALIKTDEKMANFVFMVNKENIITDIYV